MTQASRCTLLCEKCRERCRCRKSDVKKVQTTCDVEEPVALFVAMGTSEAAAAAAVGAWL